MRRYRVAEGTKDEVMAELDRYGRDRLQQGKQAVAEEFAEAWREVRDGATWVEVDGGVYRVVEGL
jgi:hypothetical protein